MKITFVESNGKPFNAPDTEAHFYKITETLVKKDNASCIYVNRLSIWKVSMEKTIQPNFQRYLQKYNTSKATYIQFLLGLVIQIQKLLLWGLYLNLLKLNLILA